VKRQLFVAASVGAALAGCSSIAKTTNQLNENPALRSVLKLPDKLDHALIGTRGSAKLYGEGDITRDFPTNGLDTPSDPAYAALRKDDFAAYRLPIGGLVERPQNFTLRQLRAMSSLSQITRHDCVEGWSVVGKFGGVPLGAFLAQARPTHDARYAIFYSFDRDQNGQQFYGSLDLVQAAHPQTMLQLDLNDRPLDADHGAPVRLRVPTQLAYKSTKWVQRIELASSFAHVFGGQGGYWEDNGYEWYAGI
jgi:DMSO/TMAO reductase YedYZ molybdopterin-dependent catalytic subunit